MAFGAEVVFGANWEKGLVVGMAMPEQYASPNVTTTSTGRRVCYVYFDFEWICIIFL